MVSGKRASRSSTNSTATPSASSGDSSSRARRVVGSTRRRRRRAMAKQGKAEETAAHAAAAATTTGSGSEPDASQASSGVPDTETMEVMVSSSASSTIDPCHDKSQASELVTGSTLGDASEAEATQQEVPRAEKDAAAAGPEDEAPRDGAVAQDDEDAHLATASGCAHCDVLQARLLDQQRKAAVQENLLHAEVAMARELCNADTLDVTSQLAAEMAQTDERLANLVETLRIVIQDLHSLNRRVRHRRQARTAHSHGDEQRQHQMHVEG